MQLRTPTSFNETESQSTTSNAIISIDNEGNKLRGLKQAPAPLTYETPKHDEINKQIYVENDILVVL